MNKTIIIRNLFLLKNQYLKYLSIILLIPMLFYMSNVLFFSDSFDDYTLAHLLKSFDTIDQILDLE